MKKIKLSVFFQVLSIFVALYGCYFNSIVTMSVPFTVTIIISTFFSLLGFLFGRKKTVSYNLFILILFIFSIISLLYTKTMSESVRFVIIYFIFFLQNLFIVYYLDIWKSTKKIVIFMSLITSIITIISWISNDFYINVILPNIYEKSQDYMQNLVIYAHSYPGIFASTGINAFFISIGYFYVLVDLITEIKSKKEKIINIILLVLYLLAIILTVKRIALLCICIISLICFFITCNKLTIKKIKTIVISVLIILGFCIVFENDISLILNKFNSSDLLNGRSELYLIAKNKINQNPILGYGINSYPITSNTNLSTHNEYLQLIYELGIFQAMVIYLLMFIFMCINIKYLIKVRNYYNKPIYLKKLLYILCIQLYFDIYCITGNPFHDFYILFIYILYLSFLNSVVKEIKNEKNFNLHTL